MVNKLPQRKIRHCLLLLLLLMACMFISASTAAPVQAKAKVYKIKSAKDWKNISKKNYA